MSLRGMLAFEEGRRTHAYLDTEGIWTIGIGHTGPEVHQGLVWSEDQIDAAFEEDTHEAVQLCEHHFGAWLTKLNDARQAVLVGQMYQMGPERMLKFVNTLAAAAAGRYGDAAKGMRDSVWGRQTPKRVVRVAEQFETGVWNPNYMESPHGA